MPEGRRRRPGPLTTLVAHSPSTEAFALRAAARRIGAHLHKTKPTKLPVDAPMPGALKRAASESRQHEPGPLSVPSRGAQPTPPQLGLHGPLLVVIYPNSRDSSPSDLHGAVLKRVALRLPCPKVAETSRARLSIPAPLSYCTAHAKAALAPRAMLVAIGSDPRALQPLNFPLVHVAAQVGHLVHLELGPRTSSPSCPMRCSSPAGTSPAGASNTQARSADMSK